MYGHHVKVDARVVDVGVVDIGVFYIRVGTFTNHCDGSDISDCASFFLLLLDLIMYPSRLLGSLLTQPTPASVENLTYWCDMEIMSSKEVLAEVPSIALYGESMSTT